ncbi:Mediator of RNA polymerase II transcription subunit 7 [Dimargaris cristalligena]|nr:Mediator of RNA polymerase II transcription subunit 7 [Dimargaris cristalligena]
MADTNAGHQQMDTAFPPPPEYFKQFTSANLKRFKELKSNNPDVPVPADLQFLEPPTIPSENDYYMFGKRWLTNDALPSLAEQDVEQLYPTDNFNRVKELRKLNNSLIFKYLDLIDTLSTMPAEADSEIDDIRLLLINMHHLINEYRPYQSVKASQSPKSAHTSPQPPVKPLLNIWQTLQDI